MMEATKKRPLVVLGRVWLQEDQDRFISMVRGTRLVWKRLADARAYAKRNGMTGIRIMIPKDTEKLFGSTAK